MRPRRLSIAAIVLLVAATVSAPAAANAADPPGCLLVPGKAGSAITANIGGHPIEKPDGWRTVDGKREAVYRVSVGDVLHIPTRLTNSGTCHYWEIRGDFTAIGPDVFDTPGSSTYETGIGDRIWGAAIGVATWDPDPNRNRPYNRRTEILYLQVYPGDTAKRLWPITVDSLPKANTYYGVRFRYDGSVSDPPLRSESSSARIWLIRE